MIFDSRVSGKVEVFFKSRFLRSAEAYLTFVSRVENTLNEKINKRLFSLGNTLVFNLSAVVDNIEPVRIVTTSSPCYELTPVKLTVKKLEIFHIEFICLIIFNFIKTYH